MIIHYSVIHFFHVSLTFILCLMSFFRYFLSSHVLYLFWIFLLLHNNFQGTFQLLALEFVYVILFSNMFRIFFRFNFIFNLTSEVICLNLLPVLNSFFFIKYPFPKFSYIFFNILLCFISNFSTYSA